MTLLVTEWVANIVRLNIKFWENLLMLQDQKGFSLIELILVATILGIISVIAIPYLQKAVGASRNANAYSSLKTISSLQVGYFSRNNRFARLDELNTDARNSLGTINGTNLLRGQFTLTMSPVSPTDAELRTNYEIIAAKPAGYDGTPCVLSINSTGVITELFGTNCIQGN